MTAAILFRKATIDDAKMLLHWRNDPLSVKYSIIKKQVPYLVHMSWITRVLVDPAFELLIACVNHKPVGMIRFDLQPDGKKAVAIAVAPEERGKKIGFQMLSNAIKLRSKNTFIANIHNGNAASQKIFTAAGFKPTELRPYRRFVTYERIP